MDAPLPAHLGDRYNASAPFAASNTAYTGAIDISNFDDDTLNDDTFVDSTTKSPQRPAFSARLLSTAQPAAAAALKRSSTILHSRAKSLANWTSSLSSPTATGANKLFGDLFAGGESVVRLGVNTSPREDNEDSEDDMDYRPVFTQRSSFASQRRSNAQQQADKTSWFGSRKSAAVASPTSITARDDLLNININNALFPHGPADPQSPADFNDLLLNATKLLERMQSAYREKVEYIASIQPEIEAQREEVEEAETRAQHLKMQLEDMSRKTQDHEQAMSKLKAELEIERGRSSTVRMINNDSTTRRQKRTSAGSASDSGFESDWDRDTESVASSNVHMPRTPSSTHMSSPFDGLDQRLQDRSIKLQRQAPLRAINLGYGRIDDNAVAWNTVQQLRSENMDLRRQVNAMQHTLQGCIDFVDTVHL